jgi:hypothetical protein
MFSSVLLLLALILVGVIPSLVSCWGQQRGILYHHHHHHHHHLKTRSSSSSALRSSFAFAYSPMIHRHDGSLYSPITATTQTTSSGLRRRDMFFQPKSSKRLHNRLLALRATASSSSTTTTAETDHHQNTDDLSTSSSSSISSTTRRLHLKRIKLYNSLTRQKELLVPVTEGKITMYTCGPTVYGEFCLTIYICAAMKM